MIIHSTKNEKILALIQKLKTNINKKIFYILDTKVLAEENILFIPTYGEEELNDDWIVFFKNICRSENINKTMIIYLYGVYDFTIDENNAIIKQIKHFTKYLSIKLYFYPLKLIHNKVYIDDILYFYNHIGNYNKKLGDFDKYIQKIIFEVRDFPNVYNNGEIDFTSQYDGFSCILDYSSVSADDLISSCDREKLVLNRCKKDVSLNFVCNKMIKSLQLKSNKIDCFYNFTNFSNLRTLILTANKISSANTTNIPKTLKYLNISKNTLKNFIIDEVIGIEKLSFFNNSLENIVDLDKLFNLKYINLGLNKIKSIPNSLYNCKNLEYINISFNDISDISDDIFNLKQLKVLDITNCNINKEVVNKLQDNQIKVIY